MEKIRLDIIAISHSISQSHNYAVILGETDGNRRLPIVIGGFEAQAIAVAVERMTPNRPLTHDLFKRTLDVFNIDLKEVIINDLIDGIFYAQLVCVSQGEVFLIDSRTSDALALSVRFNCPIYTYDFIMDSAGIEVEKDIVDEDLQDIESIVSEEENIKTKSVKDLETLLQQVLEKEDYEKAATIRDELNRRSAQQ
jgi:uncharacterized protein